MKLRLLLLSFLFSALSWGQVVIDNTATGASIPAGWSSANNVTAQAIQQSGYYLVQQVAPNIDYLYSNVYSTINGATSVIITFDIATYGSSTSTNLNVDMSLNGGGTWSTTAVSASSVSSTTYINTSVTFAGPISSSAVQFRFYDPVTGVPSVRIKNIVISAFVSMTHTVTYDGNTNTSGVVPVDGNSYNSGDTVTVLGNSGSLVKTGYAFNGWNTAANGSGTQYSVGSTFSITANTTLYAQWLLTSPPVITSLLTASGSVSSPFSYDIVATNSPTSYNATGLPAGLSINTATGQITGTPSVTGAFNVTISATNAYGTDTQTLVITILNCFTENFSGTLSQWSNTGDWTISTGEIRDNTTAAGTSYFYTNLVSFNLASANYEWNFCMRNGSFNPSTNNKFAYHIVSTNSNFPSGADGYAVGVNMSDASDLLILYAVSGTVYTPIITTSFVWDNSDDVCIRVTRTASGSWELFYNPNGSGEVSAGVITDTTVTSGNYMGGQFIHSSSYVKLLWFDDISVCSTDPADVEIDVQGNGVSIVSGDTTPSLTDDTDFGTTTIGNDISHVFTIYNTGTDPLDISSITISGVNAADFYISVSPSSTVAAGGSTTFEVTFSPTVAGTSNATINIANNDADENPYTFDIVAVSTTCTPTTSVSSISPSSGPVGTVVTINGSGFTTASSVSFSGVSASFTIVSNVLIEAIVPSGATSGNIVIQDAGGCNVSYSSYTVITKDNSSCEGVAVTTELIIYDLHDEYTGDGGFITIYNGTASTVDMVDYTLWRTSNYGDGSEIDYANLTGTIAPGALGVIRVNTAGCGPAGTNGTIDNGFNGDDQIQLRNAAGTVVIDDVHTYYNKGYYMVRNTGALSARTSYVAADWSITPLAAGQCWPSAGLVLPSGNGNSPSVTLNPVDVNASCTSSTATLTVAGTEGVAGGVGLAYQWYVNVPGAAGWTAVSNGGVYSGATSATLNISSTSGLNNYQYYCQIRENDATCYTATESAIIKDGATVWNGSSWSNGVPNIGMLAVIDGNYDTALHGDFSCCSLIVNATYRLDVRANNYIEIQNDLTVNGVFKVWDDGSLVQIDDAGVNTGNIRYERITTGTTFDYVYWSSPVDGANTPGSGYIYSWSPTNANANGGWGNWVLARNTAMAPGVGYIMRDFFVRTFAGVARNGVIQPTIARANYTGSDFTGNNGTTITNKDDNWNLVGNPYPSAIRALDFINLNTNIEGAVRIWTHGTTPSTSISDPFYDSYVYNYTPNDYIVYNGTGTLEGPAGFNGFIAGGQGFMVSMLDGVAASSTVTFNNAMRSRTYNNEQFYKTSNSNIKDGLVTNGEEKNRIWLDIINSNNQSARTLVGYVTGATYQKDRVYDAVTNVLANVMNIYSVLDNERMTIQGRTLPFDKTDKVQIAVNITTAGNYSIGIGATDGLFSENQEIYLEDKELNIIHDLRTSPYSFSIASGEFKDRFVLRYTTETLSNEDFNDNNDVLIFSNQTLNVTSNKLNIKAVTVYNVIGQLLENKKLNNTPNFVSSLVKGNQVLIVRVELENGVTVERKVIF